MAFSVFDQLRNNTQYALDPEAANVLLDEIEAVGEIPASGTLRQRFEQFLQEAELGIDQALNHDAVNMELDELPTIDNEVVSAVATAEQDLDALELLVRSEIDTAERNGHQALEQGSRENDEQLADDIRSQLSV
jgi:hypothetical protein